MEPRYTVSVEPGRWPVQLAVVAALALVASGAGPAAASHAEFWEGHNWDHPAGDIGLDAAGNLVVTAGSCFGDSGCGAAHLNTDSGFRSACASVGCAVSVSFIDEGPTGPSPAIWIEDETRDPTEGAWTEFGAVAGLPVYAVLVWETDADLDLDGDGLGEPIALVPTPVPRTPGEHTLTIAQSPDGTVDYYVDGLFVFTTLAGVTSVGQFDYLGDVYLTVTSTSGDTVTYTSYDEVVPYTGPSVA